MSEAYRCDITGDCLAEGESPNTSWIVQSGSTTILGVDDVEIELWLNVKVPNVEGKAHISQTARNAVMTKVKQYINAHF